MPIIGVLAAGGLAPGTPTIGAATAGNASATVAFTAPTWVGKGTGTVTYTATSSPGGFTGTATSSPITVSGLTNGTAYTFTVKATTSYNVTGPSSSASGSVTPVNPAPSNAYYPIGSFTVPSGGLSSITFGSIPQTYQHLEIRLMVRNGSTADELFVNFNGDTGNNYSYHVTYTYNGGLVSGSATSGTSKAVTVSNGAGPSPIANVFSPQILKINDYTSTTKNKVMTAVGGYAAGQGSQNINYDEFSVTSSMWYPTTPVGITSITFDPNGASLLTEFSNISIYGVM